MRSISFSAVWCLFEETPHRQSVLTALDESQLNISQKSLETKPPPAQKSLPSICRSLSARLRAARLWLMTGFLHISEANTCWLCGLGVVSALFSLHYSYYFSDQPSCSVGVSVCLCADMCAYREGFFHALSCPGMCNEIFALCFENPWSPSRFHIWGFSLSQLPFPRFTHKHGPVHPRLPTASFAALWKSKINTAS